MKGAGEPVFEHEFPPGSYMVDQISNAPKAAERMEFELCSRLSSLVQDLTSPFHDMPLIRQFLRSHKLPDAD